MYIFYGPHNLLKTLPDTAEVLRICLYFEVAVMIPYMANPPSLCCYAFSKLETWQHRRTGSKICGDPFSIPSPMGIQVRRKYHQLEGFRGL